jgi:L-threonylcarbamoyladenylate synthase
VRAPGLLPSHYAPEARVVLVERWELGGDPVASLRARAGGTGPHGLIAEAAVPTPPGWSRLAGPDSAQEYAWTLYAALRRADVLGLPVVVAVLPAGPDPLAIAVRDRLARAATRQ